ncbi:MAG: glutamate--tRNA ligase [Candidatus Levybacteria bacterium]|nr:glutamate--tRNA ligase [Candidatus Levybacteria bacterium]
MVRVRIAPSPTGIPHIGNTRTALYNFLFAKANSGKFILRIEDTDRVRLVPESEKAIYEILRWLGLNWDEEYKQSDRLEIYKKHLRELVDKNFAYEDSGAFRFRMPKIGRTAWVDEIGKKEIIFDNSMQEDFVIIKSDGYPTYNFANVIDDHLMQISHAIRGEEFISSTPKHIQLYNAFGWQLPTFVHLPVILGPDKTKLSKRHGAKSVLDYRDEGYLKEALLNFMVLLGWNPGGNREIISIEEMIKLFDLKDVNTASPIFDVKKLEWMNGVYIRQAKPDELISNIKYQILNIKKNYLDESLIQKLVPLAQTRITTLNDFYDLAFPFLEDQHISLTKEEKEIAERLYRELSILDKWSNEAIFSVFKKFMGSEKVKMSIFYKIFTGKTSGLPLPQTLEILGKEKTLERLKN